MAITQVLTLTVPGPQGAIGEATTPVIATSTYTAVAFNMIIADTSDGSFTITLPLSPELGDEVFFRDGAGTWSANPLTVAGNGANINGSPLNLVASATCDNFSLVYYNSAQGWIIGD